MLSSAPSTQRTLASCPYTPGRTAWAGRALVSQKSPSGRRLLPQRPGYPSCRGGLVQAKCLPSLDEGKERRPFASGRTVSGAPGAPAAPAPCPLQAPGPSSGLMNSSLWRRQPWARPELCCPLEVGLRNVIVCGWRQVCKSNTFPPIFSFSVSFLSFFLSFKIFFAFTFEKLRQGV